MPGIGRLPETRAWVWSQWFKTADSALRHVVEYLDGRLEPLNVLRRHIEQLKSLDRQRGYRREEPFRYHLGGTWHTIQLSYCSKEYIRHRWEAIVAHNRAQGQPEPELWHIRRHDHGVKWQYYRYILQCFANLFQILSPSSASCSVLRIYSKY